MRHFLLFIGGLAAGMIFLFNLGPMILLAVSVWLLYLIFKQFVKARSTGAKIGWIVLGLIVLSVGISNVYAVIGIAAAFFLYWIYKHWHEEKPVTTPFNDGTNNDPFTNFENEWQNMTR